MPLVQQVRHFSVAAFGLLVLAAPNHAQTLSRGDRLASNIAPSSGSIRATTEDKAIRPFRIDIPQSALDDLRRRVVATHWPDKETVSDQSQGVRLAKLQELLLYWRKGYD